MRFEHIDWADSDLEKISIEYDCATISVWNDALQTRLYVRCSGLAGITNLCIWDDTIITRGSLHPVADVNNDFIRQLYLAYDRNHDYGGRSLSKGLWEIRFELSNGIVFSIYCLNIEVIDTIF